MSPEASLGGGGHGFRFHHVGIAVADLDAAIAVFGGALGAELERRGEQPDMDFALLRSGGTELELLHSADPESPVGKFLERRGPGVHHVAYEIDDLDAELSRLRDGGYELAGDVRTGVHGTRVAFIHPRAMGGVLTELVERRPD